MDGMGLPFDGAVSVQLRFPCVPLLQSTEDKTWHVTRCTRSYWLTATYLGIVPSLNRFALKLMEPEVNFNNLKISSRVYFSFGMLVALIAALVGVTAMSSLNTRSLVAKSKHDAEMVVGLKDLVLGVRQGRVLGWTYMATGDESFLKGRDEAFDRFKTQYAKLDSQ